MEVVTALVSPFKKNYRLENKILLINLTTINLCGDQHNNSFPPLTTRSQTKKETYRRVPGLPLTSLTALTCGENGTEGHRLIHAKNEAAGESTGVVKITLGSKAAD